MSPKKSPPARKPLPTHGSPAQGLDFTSLVAAIAQLHAQSAARASRAVNVSLTLRNWAIGAYIRHYEQQGADRARYGARLLEQLATASYGDSIAVLFPTNRQVHGFARGFADAGIAVSIRTHDEPIDFSTRLPKLMSYHQAKGLTFDSVFLPRLDNGSFRGAMQQRIDKLLFVGVSRAIKWVFLSGTNGRLVQPLTTLAQHEHHAFLEMQLGDAAGGLFGTEAQSPLAPSAADDFGLD